MKGLLVGCAGVGRAGKDTCADLLTQCAEDAGYRVRRYAFAGALKAELLDFLIERYGISAYTNLNTEKQIIRPDLVAWGKMRRKQTNGRHWIEQIDARVESDLEEGYCVLVTDCRFNTHPKDEVGWIQSLGGKIVYIERVLEDGRLVGPASDEERENDPKVRAAADVILTIPTFQENYLDQMRPYVQAAWNQVTV